MKKQKYLFTKIAALCLAMGICTGCGTGDSATQEETAEEESVAIEETTEETTSSEEETEPYIVSFEAITTEGEEFSSECFAQSKVTMINVWATYCNPCLEEMPDLGEIAAAYDSADFQMIGVVCDVMEDADAEDIDYAKELITQTNAGTYTHLLLGESLYSSFVGAVDAVPTTFFVNQDGELLGYLEGAQSKENWEAIIDGILAEE